MFLFLKIQFVMLQARARAREVWELPEVNGYFDDQDHFKVIKGLCSYTHPMLPGAMFGNLGSLKRKLQEQHKLHFCDLCIKGRKVRLLLSSLVWSSVGVHMWQERVTFQIPQQRSTANRVQPSS
jgi:hypothetical protein